MTDFNKIDLLLPGISKYAETFLGATVGYADFVPAIFVGGVARKLSVQRIEAFFDSDDYAGLNWYLDTMVPEITFEIF